MKKRCVLLLMLAMVLAAATALAGIPKQPSTFSYVFDETDTLSDTDKETINTYGEALLQATGGKTDGDEVVALVVEFLDGMEPVDYVTQVINDWGLGDNSMLILLATGDRAVEIGAGKGLDRLVSAAARGELIDKNLDYFADGDFAGGMVALYKDVVERDASVRGKTLSVEQENETAAGTTASADFDDGDDTMDFGTILVFAVFVIFVIVFLSGAMRFMGRTSPRRRRGFYDEPPYDPGMGGMRQPRGWNRGGSGQPYGSRPSAPQQPRGHQGGLFDQPSASRPVSSSRPSSPASRSSSSGSSGRSFGGFGGLFGGSSSRSSGSGHSSSHSSSGSFGRSGGSRGSGAGRRF